MDYRQRFSLKHDIIPKNAGGKGFFPKLPGYDRLEKRFVYVAKDPSVGILTADPGIGKTACIRHLCESLTRPEFKVHYLPVMQSGPTDLYRQMAASLGLQPSFRRSSLIAQIKTTLDKQAMAEQEKPVFIIDEAHRLHYDFLMDLSAFINFDMDRKQVVSFWLLGLPVLKQTLSLKAFEVLSSRITAKCSLHPIQDFKLFKEFFAFCSKIAGATRDLFSDTALNLLYRASKGIPRKIAYLTREALMLTHENEKDFVDEHAMEEVLEEEDR